MINYEGLVKICVTCRLQLYLHSFISHTPILFAFLHHPFMIPCLVPYHVSIETRHLPYYTVGISPTKWLRWPYTHYEVIVLQLYHPTGLYLGNFIRTCT
jgi:hypothetical protein